MSEVDKLIGQLSKLVELYEAQLKHAQKSLNKAEMEVVRMMAQQNLRRTRRGSNDS